MTTKWTTSEWSEPPRRTSPPRVPLPQLEGEPVQVEVWGPPIDLHPYVENDVDCIRDMLTARGFRVVSYTGRWGAFCYGWNVLPGQA